MSVEERWITAAEMEEVAKKAKINRKSRLHTMIDGGAESNLQKNLYIELSETYKAVEKVHEDLSLLVEEDHEEAADSYLNDPSNML